jgi:transposase, IS30 family
MSYSHLTFSERNVIWVMDLQGHRPCDIARALGRPPCTVHRELKRNRSYDGSYEPATAQALTHVRQRQRVARPKTGKASLMCYVAEHLERHWSPEQICGRLSQVDFPHDPTMHLSPPTIYRWVWSHPDRTRRFRPCLRHASKKRRKPYGKPSRRGQIPDRVSIDQRPPIVAERTRVGDWEADTVEGARHRSYVATCVERRSRYLLARKMPDKRAATLNAALGGALTRVPAHQRHTLTVDNGKEFARFKTLQTRCRLDVFFAHPYRSWERGLNENTNGLLRQFLPKKTDLRTVSASRLAQHVRSLNNRPRKSLAYRTPAEVFRSSPVALRI